MAMTGAERAERAEGALELCGASQRFRVSDGTVVFWDDGDSIWIELRMRAGATRWNLSWEGDLLASSSEGATLELLDKELSELPSFKRRLESSGVSAL